MDPTLERHTRPDSFRETEPRRVSSSGCGTIVLALALFGSIAPGQSTPHASVPLCPGLTIVTAVSQTNGDYESIKTLESVTGKDVRLKYSAEGMSSDWLSAGPATLKNVVLHRTILTSDLESAKEYQQVFLEKSEETIPGTTAIGISNLLLKKLKSTGEAELSISNASAGLQLTADRTKRPNYYDYMQVAKVRRVGAAQVPVLLNDKPVELPAIRVEGDSFGDKMEFYFLDDENNPLTLSFRIGIGAIKPLTQDQASLCKSWKGSTPPAGMLGGGRCDLPNGGDRDTLRVIKIVARCTQPAGNFPQGAGPDNAGTGAGTSSVKSGSSSLEKALAEQKTVDIYSVYFSFNSDALREESQPTLKDIADVLRRHPDWKLRVDGHTDNIGGSTYNLDLSKRRSAAVKDSLVNQFGIAPGRLLTGGYGASRPKDTNETLEGRARNRRVELARIS